MILVAFFRTLNVPFLCLYVTFSLIVGAIDYLNVSLLHIKKIFFWPKIHFKVTPESIVHVHVDGDFFLDKLTFIYIFQRNIQLPKNDGYDYVKKFSGFQILQLSPMNPFMSIIFTVLK